ncbi:adenosylmethionine--8-amino-7-oxononanoate transaminase [Chlamydia pecorum]|uniref:Adenosylmethionine-8-amino-7-oxononanoate aminotransferase n=1 Tax=Chlamydia pecorum (strain ATCC VR-628 / DSM 29919 / E58) TaxID=331635 RepID=A0AA34WID2_CHLPE|nr:adenosylmethionine--8-amino-7-oxononanoate transaminase [Chlamydia pecorum]AEB42014.1 adenosylmethionine-8-amino-7-oxononanoate aminotransferase [Chlamydia pecorum E58]AGW38170.1 adenosylmethionine-8-amino-7-oxononanoate aminotransferase [Chlamydia pecorum PV3056/3]AGW39093.1 adenosylmethionine--8-amino-7-oxononanoate transaminase [Chlamydia pecorum W73]AGW40019.1 adenosylmethionine-8-amino-7-oxononanoate aminotransferase [Chlamydia pecorum P787]ETF37193.1 adenosylmethionine--8-amino-7-oxon
MVSHFTSKTASIWHPFSQPGIDPDPVLISRGEGAYLYSESGERYLDAISSWWCNLHGHAHPYIAQRLSEQAFNLEHVIFANFTHAPAKELISRLASVLPEVLQHFFFSDNGSTAIEVALKIAMQYFYNLGIERPKIAALTHGYHGDTFGAMSVSQRELFSTPFTPWLFPCESLLPPSYGQEERAIAQADKLFSQGNIAAFIYEPILQGAGGMRIYNPEGLDAMLSSAKRHGVVCIADEILTGFGRTGPMFASEYLKVSPDILCLSKGLTGGFLPLALTVTTEEIHQAFVSRDRKKALLHGHTYTGNPLGCAAALASLDLTLSPQCLQQRSMIENSHKRFVEKFGSHWSRCESLGTVLVVDFPEEQATTKYFSRFRDSLNQFFLERHLLLRPLGNTLYVLPPYCIKEEELSYIYSQLQEALCLQS